MTTPDKPQPPAPAPAPAPAAMPEPVPIYAGPVSLWMGFRTFALIAILEPLAIAMTIYAAVKLSGNEQKVLEIAGVALFLAVNMMMVYTILRIKSLRYTITTRLIEREEGMIMRRTDAVDLARVKDVELTQSILERMANVGTIEVISIDKVDPDIRIECIPNARPVYEKLRDAVIAINQRRGVILN
jgi:membrane protein YdbS with pleckstrin-like domain